MQNLLLLLKAIKRDASFPKELPNKLHAVQVKVQELRFENNQRICTLMKADRAIQALRPCDTLDANNAANTVAELVGLKLWREVTTALSAAQELTPLLLSLSGRLFDLENWLYRKEKRSSELALLVSALTDISETLAVLEVDINA